MRLDIKFKNTEALFLQETDLDCEKLTMLDHAGYLVDAWTKQKTGIYQIDNYTAVLLDEIISVNITA